MEEEIKEKNQQNVKNTVKHIKKKLNKEPLKRLRVDVVALLESTI